MPHPLVDQIRFTRSEFERGLNGLDPASASRRVGPANSIGWTIGHLAWQEQRYWLQRVDGRTLLPELDEIYAFGAPASTPDLDEIWTVWRTIVTATEPVLDRFTPETLNTVPIVDGVSVGTSVGSLALRLIYHYWYHLGEAMGIRQALGHAGLEEFVGNIDESAPYRPA